MNKRRNSPPPALLLALAIAVILATFAALAPSASANERETQRNTPAPAPSASSNERDRSPSAPRLAPRAGPKRVPTPPQIVTLALPEAPTACAQPGTAILPDPGTSAAVSQSGRYNARYDAANAFDGANGTMWLSDVWQSPAWIAVDFDDASYLVTSYDVTFSNGRLTTRAPRDWTLEGSNDGQSWEVVDTRADQTRWLGTETRTFTVQQQSSFSSYRLHITQDNDKRSDIVVASIGELRLYTECPAPDVRISHNVVPFASSCPTSFDEAVAASTLPLEVSNGAAVRYCLNAKNMGPGVAGIVVFDNPIFQDSSFTNLGVGGEGIVGAVGTVGPADSGSSVVNAKATDMLGNTASVSKDSAELLVTQGFELQVGASEFGNTCADNLGSPPVTVEIGSTVHLCYSVLALSGAVPGWLSISHSLLAEPPTSTNLKPGGQWLHGANHVVSAEDGTTTVYAWFTNALGEVTLVGEADLKLVPVDAPQPDVDIRVTAVVQGSSCPTSWTAAVAAPDQTLFVDDGTAIFYCFAVINHGPGIATQLALKHDALDNVVYPTGDLGVGGQWLHSELVTAAPETVGLTTAVVASNDIYNLNGALATDQTKVGIN